MTWSFDPPARHGSLIALGELVLALSQKLPAVVNSEKTVGVLEGIILKFPIEYLDDLNGRELTRIACCRYVKCLARAQCLPLSDEFFMSAWNVAIADRVFDRDESVQREAMNVAQEIGVRIPSFFAKGLSESFCERLDSFNGAVQLADKYTYEIRGLSLFLGALPKHSFIADSDDRIKQSLIRIATHRQEITDAACRRNATDSLLRGLDHLCEDYKSVCMITTAFLECLLDYSIDSRGDVGSWVRERAVLGLERSMRIMSAWPLSLSDNFISRSVCAILQQSAEKIDRVRETAGKALCTIVWMEEWKEVPPIISTLRQKLPKQTLQEINWLSAGQVFPALLPLLGEDTCRNSLLAGVIVSVGGLTESLVSRRKFKC